MLIQAPDPDFNRRDSLAALRQLDATWPNPKSLRKLLNSTCVTVPSRAIVEEDIAIYPGGAVAVRDPLRGVLVCDPLLAATFTGTETVRLRDAVADRGGVATLLHAGAGISLRNGLPVRLPPQAVSLLNDARDLPGSASCAGPVLIQWCNGGAAIWPLVSAPTLLALAATISAVPVSLNDAPLPSGSLFSSGSDPRYACLSPGLAEQVSDWLAVELSDALRLAVVELLVDGENSLTHRMSAALAVLPACFRLSPLDYPGDPPPGWHSSTWQLRHQAGRLVLLGIEKVGDGRRTVAGCRKILHGRRPLVVNEIATKARISPVTLESEAAMFIACRSGSQGRLGVLLEPPAGPMELYALAADLAREIGGDVIAASPCWGFCHRVGRHANEAGNASWFGMGPGLDELEDLTPDDVA